MNTKMQCTIDRDGTFQDLMQVVQAELEALHGKSGFTIAVLRSMLNAWIQHRTGATMLTEPGFKEFSQGSVMFGNVQLVQDLLKDLQKDFA